MSWPFPMHQNKRGKKIITKITITVRLFLLLQAAFYYILKSLPNTMRTTTFFQAILPQQTAFQKMSRVIYERNRPSLSPSVLVRGVPAHARRLLPVKVTRICKCTAVCELHRFLSRATDNFSQLFVGIVATGLGFFFI